MEIEKSNNSLFEDYLFYSDTEPLYLKADHTPSAFEEVNFIGSSFCPEKALLYAVLGRAYLDLAPHATKEDRRNAIKWFEAKANKRNVISYKYIVQELDLGWKYQTLIAEAVEKARLMRCI